MSFSRRRFPEQWGLVKRYGGAPHRSVLWKTEAALPESHSHWKLEELKQPIIVRDG